MRLYLCDNHLPGFPEVSLKNFSVERFVEYLVKGGVDCLMLYAKDHWGMAYFDTKVGTRHPALDYDLFAAMAEALRANGIKLMTYYSLGFDDLMATTRDDFALRTETGAKYRIARPPIGKWHACCLNTPYLDYCKEQVREVLSAHRADFLFLDIAKHGGYTGFGQDNLPLCYCECCRKKFKDRYGTALPARKDFDEHRKIIQDWEMNVLDYEMVDVFTELAQEIQPGVPVMFNETVHFNERTRERMNAHFSEGRYGSWETACISRLRRKKQAHPKAVISCHPTLTAFDPAWPAQTELAVAQVAAWDCEPFVMNGPQDAWGELDDLSMRALQDVFPKFDSYADYLEDRAGLATVLIHESDLQKMNAPADHSPPLIAAIRCLTYTNYPFGVITDADLETLKFGDAEMLLLPRARWLTDGQARAVREFVEAGGVLFSSGDVSVGDGANFALADVLGVDLLEVDHTYDLNVWGGYMKLEDGSELVRWLPQTRLPLLAPLYKVAARESARVLARLIMPCLGLAEDRWVNWFPPPPTSSASEFPAMVCNDFGAGKSVYFAAQLLDDEKLNWPKAWFAKALEFLVPDPPVRLVCDNPEFIDATYYKQEGRLVVHCINRSVEAHGGAGLAVAAGTLRVDPSLVEATAARALTPEPVELEITRTNGRIELRLPEFKVHMLVVLE